ncbi:S1C family serine protease [Clostridium sp. UBA4548]|uniref:S1C family serine protease n=1 Tax=Clostridium sp. UBA4548 TaxID=1946361 RepID=UPI0025B9AC96|nr:S1C family serine protease [Clostridium sp. UBA4548]
MDSFKESNNMEEDYSGKIKFNKKKKNYKKRFIAFTIVYLVVASVSGVCTAFILNSTTVSKNRAANEEDTVSNLTNEVNYNEIGSKVAKSVVSIVKVIGDSERVMEIDSGSGVVFKEGGYIVTNYHVVDDAKAIKIKLYNDLVYEASIIGVNTTYDLAVIKIETESVPPIKLGSAVGLEHGNQVLSVGNPVGRAFNENIKNGSVISVSEPLITVDKNTGVHSALNIIQTNIAPSSINSGSALCNTKGELIGINSIAMNHAKGTIKSSFYMTIEDAKQFINEILNGENLLRTVIGIHAEEAIPESKEGVQGVYVKEVIRNSEAYIAGLQPTDIIMEFNGEKIKYIKDMNRAIKKVTSEEIVKCKVFNNGQYKILDIKIKVNQK